MRGIVAEIEAHGAEISTFWDYLSDFHLLFAGNSTMPPLCWPDDRLSILCRSQKTLDIPSLLMVTVPRLLVFVFLVPVTLYSWFPRRSARGGT